MMDISEFINNLERYVNKKVDYEVVDDVLRVYADNESYYDFDWRHKKLDMYERNVKKEIGCWNTEKVSKVNFAMLMRNVFQNNNDVLPHELDECECLDELNLVIEKYVDKKYYSIGCAQKGKISIIFDDGYEISYSTNNHKYIIDKDTDEKYIFQRFYYEVIFFALFMKDLKQYETIFNETFSEEEIVNLIGH